MQFVGLEAGLVQDGVNPGGKIKGVDIEELIPLPVNFLGETVVIFNPKYQIGKFHLKTPIGIRGGD